MTDLRQIYGKGKGLQTAYYSYRGSAYFTACLMTEQAYSL